MAFLARRLLLLVPVLLVVSFLSFILLNLLPGNPATSILGTSATPQAVAQLDHQLRLNQGILPRYLNYLDRVVHGNFGQSYLTKVPVATELRERLPVTLELMVLSQVFAFAVAVPLAVSAARRPNSMLDRAISAGAFGVLALPAFVIGVFLVFLFAVKVHLFPATGFTHLTSDPIQNLRSMVLPSVTLGLGSIAAYLRVLRSDLIETLQQDYITMASAKGLTARRILWRHAFRPSSTTLVTVAGLYLGFLIGGTFVVEYIFQLPGIGSLTINAIQQRDYLTVQGVVLVVATGFVLLNFLVDLLYGVIDPRVRAARVNA